MSNQAPVCESRREFLKLSGLMGAGLLVGVSLYSAKGAALTAGSSAVEINAFICIHTDGSATLYAKNPEMGQGVRTALPMILAEELDLPWQRIKVRQAPLDDRLGRQVAGGSTAIKTNYDALRKAGAAAKAVLVEAAARRWQVPAAQCVAKAGTIACAGKVLHYGEVAAAAAKLELPASPRLKNPADFTIIGKSTGDVDVGSIVTGQPLFGLDQHIDGMVYATVIKPEVFNAKVISFDGREAKRIAGVIDVMKISAMPNPTVLVDGVAVVATDIWSAFKAAKLVTVKWQKPPAYIKTMQQMRSLLAAASDSGEVLRADGDVDAAFAQAGSEHVLEAVYRVPFVPHTQMEPINFIADVKAGSIRLLGPTQLPGPARAQASQISGIAEENIQVEFTRGGGGFGRRLYNECANEAVYLSQKLQRPVQVVWNREADFRGSYFRPAGHYKLKASLDGKTITAFEVQSSTTSRDLYARRDKTPHRTEAFPDQQPAGMVPNFRLSYKALLTNIPQGALRTPGVNATTFAYQCFLDELAEKARMDPIDFHLQLIGTENRDLAYRDHGGPSYNTAKLRGVIELVRRESAWDSPPPAGRRRGFAGQMVFGVYMAQVAEVSVDKNRLRIHRVTCAVDCGRVINPSGAHAQVQGGITDAVSAALYEAITLDDGRLVEQNFDRYSKLRMQDSPPVDIHFISSDAHPQGLGEPSYPVLFPALCNAIYAASGKRIRELPIKRHGFTV